MTAQPESGDQNSPNQSAAPTYDSETTSVHTLNDREMPPHQVSALLQELASDTAITPTLGAAEVRRRGIRRRRTRHTVLAVGTATAMVLGILGMTQQDTFFVRTQVAAPPDVSGSSGTASAATATPSPGRSVQATPVPAPGPGLSQSLPSPESPQPTPSGNPATPPSASTSLSSPTNPELPPEARYPENELKTIPQQLLGPTEIVEAIPGSWVASDVSYAVNCNKYTLPGFTQLKRINRYHTNGQGAYAWQEVTPAADDTQAKAFYDTRYNEIAHCGYNDNVHVVEPFAAADDGVIQIITRTCQEGVARCSPVTIASGLFRTGRRVVLVQLTSPADDVSTKAMESVLTKLRTRLNVLDALE